MIGTLTAAEAEAERESHATWAAVEVEVAAQVSPTPPAPEQAGTEEPCPAWLKSEAKVRAEARAKVAAWAAERAAAVTEAPNTPDPAQQAAQPPMPELLVEPVVEPHQPRHSEQKAKKGNHTGVGAKPERKKRTLEPPPPRPPMPPDDKALRAKWPHEACLNQLDWVSLGMEQNAKGEWRKRNPRETVREMWWWTKLHLEGRGEFFQVGGGDKHYLDKADNLLILVSEDSPALKYLMEQLGYMARSPYQASILDAIVNLAARSPVRPYHRIAFFGKDAIYIRASQNKMLRARAGEVDEVPIGTDGVVLIASDMADLPALAELKPLMNEMRGAVGNACTQLIPDLPLNHMTTRWATDSPLSPQQAQQMFVTRFMFTFAASRYSLWPIVSMIGDQGSGKSTLLELMLTLLKNDPKAKVKAFPPKEDDLVVTLFNSSIVCFDNVDTLKVVPDLICHLSTGAEVPKRTLWTTAELSLLKVQNHGYFTARTDPFHSRSDVARRTLPFKMEPADLDATVSKDGLMRGIYDVRTRIWTEILLRCENMVKAHLLYGEKHYPGITEMLDYETFTYCVSEYEGSLEETRGIWGQYRALYRESITEHSFLITAIRNWLGGAGNAGREVSAQCLFDELSNMYADTRSFPYKNPAAFGRYLSRELPGLRVIGLEKAKRTKKGQPYRFKPSPDELQRCVEQRHDFDRNVGIRADMLRVFSSRYNKPMEIDPDEIDITDQPSYPN